MKKQKRINSEYKLLRKLYPGMDRRKLKNSVYYYFSASWRKFKEDNLDFYFGSL